MHLRLTAGENARGAFSEQPSSSLSGSRCSGRRALVHRQEKGPALRAGTRTRGFGHAFEWVSAQTRGIVHLRLTAGENARRAFSEQPSS